MKEIKYKFFYPESIFDLDQISTSTFLYFDGNLATTIHPTISIFNTGCDPYKFVNLAKAGNYKFIEKFMPIFEIFNISSKMVHESYDLMKPLYQKKYLSQIWLAYPRNEDAIEKSNEIIKKSKLSIDEIYECIDKTMACQELVSHILFEKFLEFYETQIGKIDITIGSSYDETRADLDYKLLLEYCENLFSQNSVEDLLVKTYLFRLQQLSYFDDILISNNNLIPFLNSIEKSENIQQPSYYDNLDVISWEIFRQLTDSYLSTLKPQLRISKVISLKDNFDNEITTLKNKCLKLAEQFKGEKDIELLEKNIAQHVKIQAYKEIQDLLNLDKKTFDSLLDSIFSDYRSWLGISSFLSSIMYGNEIFTASAGLATLASLGSKTYKEISDNEKKIKNSEYALIYRLKNN